MSALLFIIGLGALGLSGVRLYERHLRLSPSGPTAGGAATVIDLCRRGTPPDVAAACIEEQTRLDRAAQGVIVKWGALGIAGLFGATLLRRRRRMSSAAVSGESHDH